MNLDGEDCSKELGFESNKIMDLNPIKMNI